MAQNVQIRVAHSQCPSSQCSRSKSECCDCLAGDVTDPVIDPLYRVSAYLSDGLKIQRALLLLFRFAACHIRRVWGPVQLSEIKCTKIAFVKQSQRPYYSKEMHQLSSSKIVDKSSALNALSPFLDNDGVLRVDGRTDEHLYIIPNDHAVAKVTTFS